ncbi:predicted protein [Uncinocarpus reesii 1704]|uniref:Uncharacterized protein n=1 Tax=Uncinocarpus reesii (strain UAMH 1704) TaxID=336963 RepID=C4JHQ1_UNCRE|nr:uncharacterized protein UREG_02737 [Uncinocarpus reesii 1704]EEP77888.1 predicted protein [Uncinocarpus reesii 1704]
MAGLKNAAVASVLFNKAKRKLVAIQANGASPAKNAASPEKVTKRTTARKNTGKTKVKAVEDPSVAAYPISPGSTETVTAEEAPAKKRGKRAATAKKVKAEEVNPKIEDEPIDLINDSIKLEDGEGYDGMLGSFGESVIDATVYTAAGAPLKNELLE